MQRYNESENTMTNPHRPSDATELAEAYVHKTWVAPQHPLFPRAVEIYVAGYAAALASEQVTALVEALESIKDHSDNIQKNHPDECAYGCGYSLLGQLAQSASTDAYYALKRWREWRK
jgi:hypothetical protein